MALALLQNWVQAELLHRPVRLPAKRLRIGYGGFQWVQAEATTLKWPFHQEKTTLHSTSEPA
jgi:uncharacterized protein (UPF0548 family)